MSKAKEVEVVVDETVDVTDGTGVVVGGVSDRGLIDVPQVDGKSDWVDPATVVDTVVVSWQESAEAILVGD